MNPGPEESDLFFLKKFISSLRRVIKCVLVIVTPFLQIFPDPLPYLPTVPFKTMIFVHQV